MKNSLKLLLIFSVFIMIANASENDQNRTDERDQLANLMWPSSAFRMKKQVS